MSPEDADIETPVIWLADGEVVERGDEAVHNMASGKLKFTYPSHQKRSSHTLFC